MALMAFLLIGSLRAQTGGPLTLDECHALAREHYPLIAQYGLLEKAAEFSVENANKGYLPRLTVAGQATYQSDVTELPNSAANPDAPVIPKDQYKVYGEVAQPLTDLFTVKTERKLVQANSQIKAQQLEVQLYTLKDRVNQLYFGILLIDEQIGQTELLKKDIQSGMDRTQVALTNGTAIASDLDQLRAELLNTEQRKTELLANRSGYALMLSQFIGRPVEMGTMMEIPGMMPTAPNIGRPELALFDMQGDRFDLQDRLISERTLPRFGLFFQGGLGRPALNILSDELDPYYMTGLRLNWDLAQFYTNKKQRKINALDRDLLKADRETFLFNTELTLKQQNAEIDKMEELLRTDNDIIRLREGVKKTTQVQLENGTATTNDYLISVNAEDRARQNLILHKIQLLKAQYDHKTTAGN